MYVKLNGAHISDTQNKKLLFVYKFKRKITPNGELLVLISNFTQVLIFRRQSTSNEYENIPQYHFSVEETVLKKEKKKNT